MKVKKFIGLFIMVLLVITVTGCRPNSETGNGKIVIKSILIVNKAEKSEYCIDEAVDTDGLEVIAIMSDGTTEMVTSYTTEFDSSKTGDNVSVIIKYRGKQTRLFCKSKQSC